MWFVAPRGQQRNKNRCGSTQCQIHVSYQRRCTVWWGKKEKTGRRLVWIMQNGGWAQGHLEPATLFLITVQDTSVVKMNDSSNEKDPGIHLGTHFQDGSFTWPASWCWLLAGSLAEGQSLWFLSTWTSLCGLGFLTVWQLGTRMSIPERTGRVVSLFMT